MTINKLFYQSTPLFRPQYFVIDCHQAMPDESELQNIIDEIAALIDSTLYKLTLK